MRLSTVLTATFLPTGLLAIKATVQNNCDYPLFYLSVLSGGRSVGSGVIPPKQSYEETSTEQGRAIKIVSAEIGWATGAPQFIWGYSTDPAGTYTSISTVPRWASPVDGRPGNKKITLTGSGFNCPPIVWQEGRDPGVDRINNCQPAAGIKVTFCA